MPRHQLLSQPDVWASGGTLRASIDGYPDWVVEVRVARSEGAPPVVAELVVRPSNPKDLSGGGLATRLLRRVNVGELLDLFREYADAQADEFADWADQIPEDREVLLEMSAEAKGMTPKARPGRKGHGIDFYLDWAVRYAEKIHAGVRHPNAVLARETGMDPNAVRDINTDARRRYGLLTEPPGRGRAGGQLTEKALALLAERRVTGALPVADPVAPVSVPESVPRQVMATFHPAASLLGAAPRCPYPGCESSDPFPHQHLVNVENITAQIEEERE